MGGGSGAGRGERAPPVRDDRTARLALWVQADPPSKESRRGTVKARRLNDAGARARVRPVSLADQLAEVVRRPGGDPALRCLSLLHGAGCIGRFDAVSALLELAPALDVPAGRLLEAALQVVPFGGYPRAIETLTLLGGARADARAGARGAPHGEPPAPLAPLAPRPSSMPRSAAGRAAWDAIYRDGAADVLATLEGLAPGLAGWVIEDAYGRVLSRPQMPLADRELLAVAALALMALAAPLGSHVRGALRTGATPLSVEDILESCRPLAAPPATVVLEQALDRLARGVYRA